MLKLYKFEWDCGRAGSVEGLFVDEEQEVQKAIGEDVYFGEILGKHSEVYGELSEEDLTVLSEDQEKIKWLIDIMDGVWTISGYNPLNYILEE
jgi:hypothetical protein